MDLVWGTDRILSLLHEYGIDHYIEIIGKMNIDLFLYILSQAVILNPVF